MKILYDGEMGLVYPSLYEGFGIPPLEAMKCGTVAVAANSSSIPDGGRCRNSV
jgi:glycosyltransferase involved in cell wall biosynthesis